MFELMLMLKSTRARSLGTSRALWKLTRTRRFTGS